MSSEVDHKSGSQNYSPSSSASGGKSKMTGLFGKVLPLYISFISGGVFSQHKWKTT